MPLKDVRFDLAAYRSARKPLIQCFEESGKGTGTPSFALNKNDRLLQRVTARCSYTRPRLGPPDLEPPGRSSNYLAREPICAVIARRRVVAYPNNRTAFSGERTWEL